MSQMTFDFSGKPKKTSKSDSPQVYSVSQLNRQIKGTIESAFPKVWVQGEISNFTAHSSGHYYFSLKDKNSQISAVMFRGHNSRLKFKPEAGMEVVIKGKVTLYEPRGNYQLFCEEMEPLGAGALQIAFEQLKGKLQAEGLFDSQKKRALPSFPKTIALVTSPTGAAVRDMLQVLGRRFKAAHILVVPAVVQGDAAAASLVEALDKANKVKLVDVIIIGRGGGSIEDLWCFNDETLARAIAASQKPIVSAVGHEVDFTISDFVADLRAPTPSAAAELVVKSSEEIKGLISQSQKSLLRQMKNRLVHYRDYLHQTQRRLVDPQRALQDLVVRCDELTLRLERGVTRYLKDHREHLGALVSLLNSLSPLNILERGYSIISTKAGHFVTDSAQVKLQDKLSVRLSRGDIEVTVSALDKSQQE